MKPQIMGLKVASVIFMCVALVHLLRVAVGWDVQIGGHHFGIWASILAAFVCAGLSAWLGRLACGCRSKESIPQEQS